MTDDEAFALAEKAAKQLQGSCLSLESLGKEFEQAQDNQMFCARLDDLVFNCEYCGWWYEQSEMHPDACDEWFCQDCGDE